MTDSNLSEIICVIDRSGSMDKIRDDAIGGFNAFLTEQQKAPGQAKLTLVLFDNEYLVLHDGVDIKEVPKLTSKTFVPRGSTALLDAIGHTIELVGKRLSETSEEQRPATVIMAILTDGQENSSRGYNHDQIFSIIKHQREVYSWEFVFLAADQDAFAVADQLAIGKSNTQVFASTGKGVRDAYTSISRVVSVTRAKKRKDTPPDDDSGGGMSGDGPGPGDKVH